MIGEDKLVLNVGWDGGRIVGVSVASSRRTGASRLLEGKTPEQAAQMVPLLFSLCGRAQEAACVLALGAARGHPPDAAAWKIRERQVLGEAAMESLWRILVDWPPLVGEVPVMESLAGIHARLRQALPKADEDGWRDFSRRLESFLEREVLSLAPAEWLGMERLDEWAASGKTAAARVLRRLLEGEGLFGDGNVLFMPPPQAEMLVRDIEPAIREWADFPARPHWAGEIRETGALARMVRAPLVGGLQKRVGNTVALRFAARLVELAGIAGRLRGDDESPTWLGAVSPRPGWGLAWAECARGLLLHQVQVEDGRMACYRIVAPTEWNFHPDGPLVRGLRGVDAASEAAVRYRATAMVQALDPCVAYEIGVYHA